MKGHFVHILTYVLELENNKWYVGISMCMNVRMSDHFAGNGSRWTKKHKPVRIERVVLGDRERELTLQYMLLKGWKNVRGGSWCRVDMKRPPECLSQFVDDKTDDDKS